MKENGSDNEVMFHTMNEMRKWFANHFSEINGMYLPDADHENGLLADFGLIVGTKGKKKPYKVMVIGYFRRGTYLRKPCYYLSTLFVRPYKMFYSGTPVWHPEEYFTNSNNHKTKDGMPI